MVAVVVVLALCALAAAALRDPVRRIQDDHALAGRFGEAPREALLTRWGDVVVATAERYERLHHFQDQLRARAWKGTPLRIDHDHGGWCDWHFADGEVWRVRHDHRLPRATGRLIVGGAGNDHDGALAVRTYVPGSVELVLPVVDAVLLGA